jgi:hypothetical protein
MPFTGDTCTKSGIYKVVNHILHPKQVTMIEGKQFPPCSECKTRVQYELFEATKH